MPSELICPVCMGPLTRGDGDTAHCAMHGGDFRVLCTRVPLAGPPESAPVLTPRELSAGAMCAQHAAVPAAYACAGCGTALCETCAFLAENGVKICVACATKRAQAPAAPRIAEGMRCVQHPSVPATLQCQSCGAYMCATCDFALPGGMHICPSCATAPREGLSGRRKGTLIWSFALAVFTTVIMALVFSGSLAKLGVAAIGNILWLGVLLPALVGLGLGVATMERRLGNPPLLWVAVVWNGIIMAGVILLCIIGLFAR